MDMKIIYTSISQQRKKITLKVREQEITFTEEELSDVLGKYFDMHPQEERSKKIIIPVRGEEMSFTEEGLTSILEAYYDEFPRRPKKNEYFRVNPSKIDRNLFKYKKNDEQEEKVRQIIAEAFEEVDKNPERYNRQFYTIFPDCDWYPDDAKVGELEGSSKYPQSHLADWVEQAMEWAQRIQNGEFLSELCEEIDPSEWYRLVLGKDNTIWVVGSATHAGYKKPATDVAIHKYNSEAPLWFTVGLYVHYNIK